VHLIGFIIRKAVDDAVSVKHPIIKCAYYC